MQILNKYFKRVQNLKIFYAISLKMIIFKNKKYIYMKRKHILSKNTNVL